MEGSVPVNITFNDTEKPVLYGRTDIRKLKNTRLRKLYYVERWTSNIVDKLSSNLMNNKIKYKHHKAFSSIIGGMLFECSESVEITIWDSTTPYCKEFTDNELLFGYDDSQPGERTNHIGVYHLLVRLFEKDGPETQIVKFYDSEESTGTKLYLDIPINVN